MATVSRIVSFQRSQFGYWRAQTPPVVYFLSATPFFVVEKYCTIPQLSTRSLKFFFFFNIENCIQFPNYKCVTNGIERDYYFIPSSRCDCFLSLQIMAKIFKNNMKNIVIFKLVKRYIFALYLT